MSLPKPYVPSPDALPIERRHHRLSFESADGSCGCTAYPINYDEIYNLKGRLLTLIDATNGDLQQRKALKDLVWQTLQHWMDDIEKAAGYEPHPIGVTAEPDESIRLV